MDIGDVWEMTATWNLQNQDCTNVLHLVATANVTGGATNQEITDALDAFFFNESSTWNPDAALYRGSHLICRYGTDIGEVRFATANIGSPGVITSSSELMPKQCAALITKRHAKAVKGNRGRMYCGFLTESTVVNGRLSGVTIGLFSNMRDWIANGDTIIGVGGSTAIRFVIANNANLPAIKLIDSCVVSPDIATQRRRGDFGRQNT